jgi:hypothetical protein
MERALKSFLDGVSEDDNVVNLDHVVKNDNDESEEEEAKAVIAQGSSSGMLDIRDMARRYQEMSAGGNMEVRADDTPLPGQILRDHLLAPVVESDEEPRGLGWIVAAVCCGVVVTIVATAAVTATLVKSSVMAEIHELGLVPAVAQAEPAPAEAAVPAPLPEASLVAEWPEPDPALVAAADSEEEEASMDFEGEAIDVKRRERKDESESRTETRPALDPAVAAAIEAPSTTPTPVPTPTPTPAPTPAPAPVETKSETVSSDGEVCDEVLCLVEGRGCCGKVGKKAADAEPEVDTSLPERLSRADIDKGLKKINGRLNSCGARHGTTGVVTMKLKISPEGKVQKSSTSTGGAEFQSCVGKTLSKARFTRTQEGASLSYPVILR